MTLLWLIASSCLLISTVWADKTYPLKIVKPGDDLTFWPDVESKRSVNKWSFETCDGCRIVLSCVLLLPSCLDHILTINDGQTVKTFCGEDVNYALRNSIKNKINFSIENEAGKSGSFCRLLVTKPYTNTKYEKPDSSEHGLGIDATRQPSCKCGWTNKSPSRIVGGTEARMNEYPFTVLIMLKRKKYPFCGGSIITPKHVLTAAHCTKPVRGIKLSVIVGTHYVDPDKKTPFTKIMDVKKTIEHPQYKDRQHQYDIAVLELEKELEFNDMVGPVCLPKSDDSDYFDEYLKVLGWGHLETNGTMSPTLQKVDLKVIDIDVCKTMFASVEKNTNYQLCTWGPNKDSCQGDSGGPLVWQDPETKRLTQLGVVSFGRDCGSHDPAVNSKVSYFIDWIKQIVSETSEEICV